MTKDEILRIANEVYGIDERNKPLHVSALHHLQLFAEKLLDVERNRTWRQEHWTEYERKIAAEEREMCAQVADEWNDAYSLLIAEAIRARGNT